MSNYSGPNCDFFLHTIVNINGVDNVLERGMAVYVDKCDKGWLREICDYWSGKGEPLECYIQLGNVKFKIKKFQQKEQTFDFNAITEAVLTSNTAETAKPAAAKPAKEVKQESQTEFEDDIPF